MLNEIWENLGFCNWITDFSINEKKINLLGNITWEPVGLRFLSVETSPVFNHAINLL